MNLWKNGQEGMYLVQHGNAPVRDLPNPSHADAEPNIVQYNYWARSFPLLFPYGIGAPEAPRSVSLSLKDHARWLLEQQDRRFRTHETFAFVVCNMQQKRDALFSSSLQVKLKDFRREHDLIQSISTRELQQAADEEKAGRPITSNRAKQFKKIVFATASRVLAADSTRFKYRQQLRSLCMSYGPPNVWITINPDDLHDPIAQIFIDDCMNLDEFSRTSGPTKNERSHRMAQDPFAAAKFFHFMVETIMETLFGVKTTSRRYESTGGILGSLRAHFGTVECQGRGTLHLHLLVWLNGAPTASVLRELLQTNTFRQKVQSFLRANFRSYYDELATEEAIDAIPTDPEVAFCRPPNPDDPKYWDKAYDLEVRVARTKMMHSCSKATCLVQGKAGLRCKRRAPWPLSTDDIVMADGTYIFALRARARS